VSSERNRRLNAECREWLTLLESGDATGADHNRFQAWLRADPRHERAYARLQLLWNELGELRHVADLEPLSLPSSSAPPRLGWMHPSWAAAAAIVALTLLAVWNWLAAPPAHTIAAEAAFDQGYSTRMAEVREISLPDGSTMTLGARSQASVRFTAHERRVRLEQGEAFFDVAKNPARPFYVEAANATLRVVGTRFEVHRGSGRVRIAVAEGIVAVDGNQAPLTSGQRIHVLANGTLTPIETITDSSIGAWRQGRLIYESATLEEIVADLSRYRSDVALSSADVGRLRITAGLRIEQIDQFLNGLPAILPVQVIRAGTLITIDEPG